MSGPVSYAVVVLAGGTSRRLGGGDKTALDLGAGRSVLDHLVSGLDRSVPVVVVGPRRPLERSVRWARESPPGGGPLAGLSAGLSVGLSVGLGETDQPEWVVLLAGDQPFAAEAVGTLLAAATPDVDAVLAVDEHGRDQLLLAAYRREPLTAALLELGAAVAGGAVRDLVRRLRVGRVSIPGRATLDVDDEASLARARAEVAGRGQP